jgi:uncharacterized phage-associated protein
VFLDEVVVSVDRLSILFQPLGATGRLNRMIDSANFGPWNRRIIFFDWFHGFSKGQFSKNRATISAKMTANITAHDVAAYILEKSSPLTTMKLQKLVYYSQAWSLVWDEKPLFAEKIEAWTNGPVVPALYKEHKGKFQIASWPKGNAKLLGPVEQETVDAVLSYYGGRSSQWLSDLSHREQPWKEARRELEPGDPGIRTIKLASMAEYYCNPY